MMIFEGGNTASENAPKNSRPMTAPGQGGDDLPEPASDMDREIDVKDLKQQTADKMLDVQPQDPNQKTSSVAPKEL